MSLIVCLFLMLGSVCAADADIANDQENTVAAADTTVADDTVSEVVSSEEMSECYSADYSYSQGEIATSGDNVASSNKDNASSDVLGAGNDELLGDDVATFTDLGNEVSASGNTITLTHKYYQYTSGENYAFQITNKVIDGNGATIDGSNLQYPFKSSGNLILKNINFINIKSTSSHSSALQNGGVIVFADGSSNIVIENCNFTKITRTLSGAGVLGFPKGKNITIKKCNFQDTTSNNAAIVFCDGNMENILIEDCKFDKITAANNGVFMSYKGILTNFTLRNSEFTTITMNRDDSWIVRLGVSGEASNCEIVNCKFINKTSTYANGGIELIGDNNTVKNCYFENIISTASSTSENNFGAVTFDQSSNDLIENCTFINCRAWWGPGIRVGITGGAFVYNATINNCRFYQCCSTSAGGAIYISGHNKGDSVSYVHINNCYFEGCIENTISRGSCIEINSQHSSVVNSTFVNSKGYGSGAIGMFKTASDCHIINCIFINNTAEVNGGAISSEYEECNNAFISNCTFINNSATGNGGAIVFRASNSTIQNCVFIGNNASEGGAVQFNAPNGYMVNCTYSNNTASTDGGALCSNSQGSTVETCKFSGNNAPIGIDFYAHTGCEITFIGLSFQALWLTNDGDIKVTSGHGTSWDNPASWDRDNACIEFLNTNSGKTTIYLKQQVFFNQVAIGKYCCLLKSRYANY